MKTSNAIITIIVACIVGYIALALVSNNGTSNHILMEQSSELGIQVIEEGTGPAAETGDAVDVHYTGTLTDGTVFDSSVSRGVPFTFTLGEGRVIQGWELGVLGMKVGEKRTLTIPPELGYGAAGAGQGLIPPNATLMFDVELIAIN